MVILMVTRSTSISLPSPHSSAVELAQNVNVSTEVSTLMGVPEQIVTGQCSAPVIKLIQVQVRFRRGSALARDAVVVAFWLTDLQKGTHCPIDLGRAVFDQIAADMNHVNDFGDLIIRQRQIQDDWNRFHPGLGLR